MREILHNILLFLTLTKPRGMLCPNGTVKPFLVSLVEPVAYLLRLFHYHSRLTWRVRNSPGCCPAFLSAAKAPGVATIWPSSKAGCLLSCCIGKTPFLGFVFCFLEAPQRAVH